MRQSEQINEIAKALVAVQLELAPITKDSRNPHFQNTYASLDTIIEYVRPILAKEGLAVVQGGEESNDGIVVTTQLVHTSGQWISTAYKMPLEKATAQSAGSAITYGRRYGLGALLALATEDDDDAERATPKAATASRNGDESKPTRALDEPQCPKCGGRLWDNRLTKTNPKQPDFKCRDRSCDGVIWPAKEAVKA